MAAVLDRERLSHILGMLGSAHDGEVLAAARQAERLRREAGATWPDLLAPAPALVPPPRRLEWPATVEAAINLCVDHAHALSDWERDFIASIARRPWRLSGKQSAVVERLVHRIIAGATADG